jgi:ABC-type Fe3+ transport system permease subunit
VPTLPHPVTNVRVRVAQGVTFLVAFASFIRSAAGGPNWSGWAGIVFIAVAINLPYLVRYRRGSDLRQQALAYKGTPKKRDT